jgi:osmotically-inducible protein OsmY
MSDKNLRLTIIDELDFEPSVDSANIGVAVENGVVTLTGHVKSYAEKLAAEQAVRRVKGVRALAEELFVTYPSDKKTSDADIAQRAANIIAWDVTVPDAVKVKVEKGWVTLSGMVHWQYQRQSAETAIRKLSGVIGVTNLIELQPQAHSYDVKKAIEEALKRNAEVEAANIRVKVGNDNTVTLEGKVHAWHERGIAERAAWSAPGVKAVDDRLMVA